MRNSVCHFLSKLTCVLGGTVRFPDLSRDEQNVRTVTKACTVSREDESFNSP